MKQEDRQVLLKDLSARLPYKVIVEIVSYADKTSRPWFGELSCKDLDCFIHDVAYESIKPYLRPMSSMTEEERSEFSKLLVKRYCEEDWEGHISTSYCIEIDDVYIDDENRIKYPSSFSMDAIDWLNANQFDYRGLIHMGLAIEAPEGMYNIN